ncbi:MAG: hypothetical protein WAM24_08175 [Ignavibacteriaceae bacterium]
MPVQENEWFNICSKLEIGAMEIAALLRAAYRDYVDLFFLLKEYNLEEIFKLCEKKYSGFEKSVYRGCPKSKKVSFRGSSRPRNLFKT